ncbi:cytochrome c3 family protein [Benzoatithermus flavus]|uniref:Cytochrome c3 family protein n=1 Tax=Benzoatithermus flavus TaxID=3108223 RepID=A0ABU8XQM7_9PROT
MRALSIPFRVALLASAGLVTAGVLWLGSGLRLERIAERPLLPTRFDHKFHTGVNCTTCHHNFRERGLGTKPCLACHKAWGTTEARRIDTVFHAFCTDCHRREQATGAKAGPVKACVACHVARARPVRLQER